MRPRSVDYARALEMVRNGMTSGEIARELGCDRSTIRRWRKREGISASMTHPDRDKRAQAMTDLRAQGLSFPEIGKRMGLTTNTVVGIAHRARIRADRERENAA